MKQTDIAYIAGIVDGEGYIGVKKSRAYRCQGRATPSYHARIQIRMVDEPAIRFIAEALGGWYYREKPSAPHKRPLFCYQASDKAAETILRRLLPFLRVKRLPAENVLALRTLQAEGRKNRTKIVGYRTMPGFRGGNRRMPNLALSDEYVARCEAICARSKALNHAAV